MEATVSAEAMRGEQAQNVQDSKKVCEADCSDGESSMPGSNLRRELDNGD